MFRYVTMYEEEGTVIKLNNSQKATHLTPGKMDNDCIIDNNYNADPRPLILKEKEYLIMTKERIAIIHGRRLPKLKNGQKLKLIEKERYFLRIPLGGRTKVFLEEPYRKEYSINVPWMKERTIVPSLSYRASTI